MMRRICLAALVFGLAAGRTIAGQSLERRVASSAGEAVQFHFAAREGVCGNGRSWMRAEDNNWYGTFSSGAVGTDVCGAGPVRVVLTRAGSEVVKVETFAGPLVADANAGTDLGAVGAREASVYLIGLAGTLDGRPARESLLPAMLADSTVVTALLTDLVKNQRLARDVRRSAMTWLARRRGEMGGVGAASVERTLDQLVRNRDESESVRQQALSTIAGFDRGEGIPSLMTLAGETDSWLSRQALGTLARSGDPRARKFTRAAVQRAELSDESRVTAIQGLGNEYATAADHKLLRDLYAAASSDRSRDAIINTLATAGGAENIAWLLAVAKSQNEPAQRRKRAISLLSRYDDQRVRDALKELIER